MAEQFDLYLTAANEIVLIVQSDQMDNLSSRVFAPCFRPERAGLQLPKIAPRFYHAEQEYRVMVHLLGTARVSSLGRKIGNLAHLRDDIIRAFDLLLTGT